MPFQKGQIPNPKGYPSRKQEFALRFKHYADLLPSQIKALNPDKLPIWDALIVRHAQESYQDASVRQDFFNRVAGKPKESMDVNTNGEVKIVMEVKFDD